MRKYFNVYLLNCKKMKLQDDISLVEKFKNIVEKIEGNNDTNMQKLLNMDNEKIAKMLDAMSSGKNVSFVDNKNNNNENDSNKNENISSVKSDPKIPAPSVI